VESPRSRVIVTALPMSPTRALLALLRTMWRRHRCGHPDWVPFEQCPDCGKEAQ